MKRTLISAIVIALVIGGLFAAMAVRKEKPAPPTTQDIWAKEGIPVETGTVIIGDMQQAVQVTGDISALSKVTLSAKVAGRVVQVLVREGDRVSVGTTVAILDQADALSNLKQADAGLQAARTRLSQAVTNAKVTRIQTDAGIEQAKASLESAQARLAVAKKPARSQELMVAENAVAAAKANLDNAEASYNRQQKLLKEGAISESVFDLAKTQYAVAKSEHKSAMDRLSMIKEGGRREDVEAAEAQVNVAREQLRSAKANAAQNLMREEDIRQASAAVKQAEAAVAMAQQQLSYTVVKSSISGEVASRLAEPGQVVSPGQPLIDVVDLGSVYFKGDISEKELANVRKGQAVEVTVDALEGRTFSGRVQEVYPAGSAQSRNFPVRIAISQANGEVRPGMFARGRIISGVSRGVLLVPKDAVEERRGTKMVFVLVDKHKVRRQDVEVVREDTDYVEIGGASGLSAGDMLVTQGRQNLQDGSLVRTSESDKR